MNEIILSMKENDKEKLKEADRGYSQRQKACLRTKGSGA